MSDIRGSFPVSGPITYLTDDPDECKRLMRGVFAPPTTWFHGTTERVARLACRQGLVPGCWIAADGGCCGVLGLDSLEAFLERRAHLWILEVVSPAIESDIKALWVAPKAIRGAWHRDLFYARDELAAASPDAPTEPVEGCQCPLATICAEQQAIWRTTWR
jgi:hypothetical protein